MSKTGERVRRALDVYDDEGQLVHRGDRSLTVTRAFALDDIYIRPRSKGGDGRTVDAYAAVFMSPAEIVDQDGHYDEQNDYQAFSRSLAERSQQIFSVYNHAKSLDGTPSDLWSVPLGKPREMVADRKGLFTSTPYDPGPENDRILEAVRSGAIGGMSYTGVFVQSTPELRPGQRYHRDADGKLPLVTRQEIALIEFGPTPIPAFEQAVIVGVRSREAILLNGSHRNIPAHHTEVTSDDYDADKETSKLPDPTSWDHMTSMYALADEAAGDDDGHYPRSSGYLPHHVVGPDGNPGAASLRACREGAQRADGIDGFTTDEKQKAKAHLRAHIEDAGATTAPDNKTYPSVVTGAYKVTSSTGRGEDEGQERVLSGASAPNGVIAGPGGLMSVPDGNGTVQNPDAAHAAFTGKHAHGHMAHGGPDDDRDGYHGHEHMHDGDSEHNHPHPDGTSGRAADTVGADLDVSDHEVQGAKDHGSFNGLHAHAHEAHGGPDDNNDGVHGHEHMHQNDNQHAHAHPSGTSGRAGNDGDADDMPADSAHGIVSGEHSHAHPAYGGPGHDDGNMHEHVHNHMNDGSHNHTHPEGGHFAVKASSSGDRTPKDEKHVRWDAQKAWSAGSASNDPGAFYRGICAGRRKGDPKLQSSWALPHHYTPGGPADPGGVRNGLSRISQTQGLVNATAAKAHLEAHMRSIQGGEGDKNKASSSGRQPAANAARVSQGAGTGPQPHGPHSHPVPTANTPRSKQMDLMTIDQRVARLDEVQHRLREIDQENMGAELPADTRTEWTSLQEELIIHQRAIKDAKARAQYLAQAFEDGQGEGIDNSHVGYGDGNYGDGYGDGNAPGLGIRSQASTTYRERNGRGSPQFYSPMKEAQIFDLAAIRQRAHNFDEVPMLMRENAMRALEIVRYSGPKSREDCQETVAHLLERIDDDMGSLARRVLVTGSPVYDRAFGKMLGQLSTNGLTAEESRSLQLGVDSAGGFAVPFQLDPTVILSSNGAINPLRQISRVEQITGKEWDGVTSAGVVVNRVSEGTEAATGDPAFVQPNVRTTRVQGFVPFNIELDVSWGALRSQMTNLLMDAKDIEEATSFALGNGTAPNANGVVTTLHDLTPGSVVSTAGTATLAIADLYSVENNMAPRFRQQSSYLASKTTFNRFRQLFQALASAAFDSWVRPSAGTPATFNGYPAYELSTMSNAITSGSLVLLQGDYSQFLIVDRVGMGIELIPHLFGGTNRFPVGQRGILAIWFNNSKILVPNAFRLLQVT